MEVIVKTLKGLEGVLEKELNDLGIHGTERISRAVRFEGSMKDIYTANLRVRTALRVICPIASFKATSPDTLYRLAYRIGWEELMDVDKTFSIDYTVYSRYFKHSQFAALKLKDAIADRFMNKMKRRPSVDKRNPHTRLNLHVNDEEVTISLDASGAPLNMRGYRAGSSHQAPLNEVLAAGLVLMSGWDGKQDFADLFCGSGTILIEAALIANNMAPNLNRKRFAFMNWPDYDGDVMNEVVGEAMDQEIESETRFFGRDINLGAVNQTLANIEEAGLDTDQFDIKTGGFDSFNPPTENGVLISNPPYGERLSIKDTESLYGSLGRYFKHTLTGWNAWVISGSQEGMWSLGLRPEVKHDLLNGSIDCKYHGYELFGGKRSSRPKK